MLKNSLSTQSPISEIKLLKEDYALAAAVGTAVSRQHLDSYPVLSALLLCLVVYTAWPTAEDEVSHRLPGAAVFLSR